MTSLSAQEETKGSIRGSLLDESTRHPVEFVNVVLLRKSDSSIVTGKVTDKSGKFNITDVSTGEYSVKFSLIGYKEKRTPYFSIDSLHKHLNLGEVTIVATPVDLEEVLVTADKSMFNNSIDRKVYNVDQDLMSKAGSASELLQNVPSVQVDIDGNVSLRGSSNVLIMVNGKSSALMDRSSAEALQQMPASSIDRIEVITNPSAKYKPDGTSGIINIVLKKNTGYGINGNLTANAGNQGRYNGNARINYNSGTYNIFASYGLRKDNRNRTTSDSRQQIEPSSVVTRTRADLFSYARPLSNSAALGLDYRIDDRNEAGTSGNFFINAFTRTDNSGTVRQNDAGVTTEAYSRNRYDPEYEKEFELTAYFEHVFPKEDHKFRAEVNLSRSPEQEDNHFTNVYAQPAISTTYDNTLIKQDETRTQVSLDYSNPLNESSSFEAGYAGEFRRNDLDFRAESFDQAQQRFVRDSIRTNRFLYNGDIHAVYGTFRQSLGAFGFQAGLRAEPAKNESHLVTRDSVVSNDYFSLFPTLHLSYKVGRETELQLSYSRRVHRPHEEDLNPFPEYRDPRNISAGNPYLLPEYIQSIELGCQFQNELISVLPALYYRYTYNRFTSMTRVLDDSTLLTTRENLSNGQSGGLEVVVTVNVGGLFAAHWSANAFHDQIDASNLGYTQNRSTTTWGSNLTFDFNMGDATKLQMNSNYNSSRLTPQGEYVPTYVVNMGFRQELFEGKVSFVTTVSDLFATQKRQLELNTPSLNQTVINTRDSRIVYLGFTYHFGAPPKKSKEEQLRYDNGE